MNQLTLVIGNKNYSSWSLRPWLAMKQAGINFAEILIPLYTPTSKSEILQYSSAGKVPILIDGKLVIWESIAICEYIAERFAPELWPSDPALKALARSVSAEMHAGFVELRKNMSMDIRNRYPGQGLTPAVQDDIDRISNIWQECLSKYSSGDFLFGKFSIADAMFAPVATRFVTYEVKLNAVCQNYVENIYALPAMQEWLTAATQETEVIKW